MFRRKFFFCLTQKQKKKRKKKFSLALLFPWCFFAEKKVFLLFFCQVLYWISPHCFSQVFIQSVTLGPFWQNEPHWKYFTYIISRTVWRVGTLNPVLRPNYSSKYNIVTFLTWNWPRILNSRNLNMEQKYPCRYVCLS